MSRIIVSALLLTLVLDGGQTTASSAFMVSHFYVCQKPRSCQQFKSVVSMVSDLFMGSKAKSLPQLPRDVKDAVSRCREATQAALQDRISRMDIEFPVGTKFSIEKAGNSKKRKGINTDDNKPTKDDFDRSDRELARIFVEMFQPVGGDNLIVTFSDEELARAAKNQWSGDATAAAQIVSMNRRKSLKKTKKSPPMGFAATLAAEVDDEVDESGPFRLPSNTEVAMFVAPGPKELLTIKGICENVGMGTLVILLNARLSTINNFGSSTGEVLFRKEFQSVFSLAAANQASAPGCLLHRTYGKNWILARKPKVGPPETILVQEMKPTDEECRFALDELGLSSDAATNIVESAALGIAQWFR
jgi:Domain of unknown function (DUF1995)